MSERSQALMSADQARRSRSWSGFAARTFRGTAAAGAGNLLPVSASRKSLWQWALSSDDEPAVLFLKAPTDEDEAGQDSLASEVSSDEDDARDRARRLRLRQRRNWYVRFSGIMKRREARAGPIGLFAAALARGKRAH